MSASGFELDVREVLAGIGDLLIAKNRRYGNSALDPIRVFSDASPEAGLRIRLDDKLSRLARGEHRDEDVEDAVLDALGYLVLLKVAELQRSRDESWRGEVRSSLTSEIRRERQATLYDREADQPARRTPTVVAFVRNLRTRDEDAEYERQMQAHARMLRSLA